MAKNPTKGFTMAELERLTAKAEKEMNKNAEILNKQNPETDGPNYEKIEEFDHPGADGYDGSVEKTDSPLGMYAYVSTAPHFQRLQDNIAAAFTPKKKTGPTSEDKKNQAEEAYWKSKTTTSEENNPFKGEAERVSENLKKITDKGFKDYSAEAEFDSKSGSVFDKDENNYFRKFGQ